MAVPAAFMVPDNIEQMTPQQFSQVQKILLNQHTTNFAIKMFIAEACKHLSIGMAKVFAQTAAKYTPPNMGKSYIDPKYYYRPIQDLKLLAKGQYGHYHATKADYKALRQGYKFRVLNTKYKAHKKNDVYAYTKGINEAKRVARIQNRGLSRYSWGNAINNSDEDREAIRRGEHGTMLKAESLPLIFQRLARKSPNITKYQFGSVKTEPNNPRGFLILIKNRLAQIQQYGHIAIKRGSIAVNRWWNSTARAVLKKDEQKLQKIFDKIGAITEVKF